MNMTETPSETATATPTARTVDLKLEVVVIPVADVERAKRFYGGLGWRLDADFVVGDEFHVVQFTPPGSPSSIHFGKGVTSATPGSAPGLFLVVSDIVAARAELVSRGAEVSEVFHRAGPGKPPLSGPEPERRSYSSYATFSDPDGNEWLLQEITHRLPGRVDAHQTTFTSSTELAAALRRAAAAHGEHEKRTGGQRASQGPLSSLLSAYQRTNRSVWPTREATMDFNDRRLWDGVAVVIVVLIVIAYAAGRFGGTPPPAPQQ